MKHDFLYIRMCRKAVNLNVNNIFILSTSAEHNLNKYVGSIDHFLRFRLFSSPEPKANR